MRNGMEGEGEGEVEGMKRSKGEVERCRGMGGMSGGRWKRCGGSQLHFQMR